ncbi:hypothetical protein MTR_1g034780 [Medicago truncatula]|uniref:Uncharacterized protein n=1 Tax=Medicago truncatula TaxID=3880 RepID=G7IA08_MEDTR|nr:hypothetical protein MTR_1g034780 [Medicago truncatula]
MRQQFCNFAIIQATAIVDPTQKEFAILLLIVENTHEINPKLEGYLIVRCLKVEDNIRF